MPIRERTTCAIAFFAACDDSNFNIEIYITSRLKFSLSIFYLPPTRLPSLSNTAIPSRISFHRINGKLTQLAPATAANGTNRAIIGGNFATAAKIKFF